MYRHMDGQTDRQGDKHTHNTHITYIHKHNTHTYILVNKKGSQCKEVDELPPPDRLSMWDIPHTPYTNTYSLRYKFLP